MQGRRRVLYLIIVMALASFGGVALAVGIFYNMADVHAPFIRGAIYAGLAALLIVTVTAFVLVRIANPLIRELAGSEERLHTLVRNAGSVIIFFAPDGEIIQFNDKAEEVYGYTRAEVVGRNYFDFLLPEEVRDEVWAAFSKVVQGTPALGFENPVKPKNGELRTLLWNANALPGSGGKHGSVVAIGQDVTERNRAEELLKESERLLRDAERLSKLASWSWIVETDSVLWSNELYSISGWDLQLPPPTFATLSSFYTAESWEKLKTAVERAVDLGDAYELELDMVRPDGQVRNTLTRGTAVKDSSGRVARLYGTVQDITERKKTEEEMLRFRAVLDQAGEAIFLSDPNDFGRIIDVNQTVCDWTGYSRDELLSMQIKDLQVTAPVHTPEQWRTIVEQIRSNSGPTTLRGNHRRKDGTSFPVEVSVSMQHFSGRDMILGVARDITRKVSSEEKLASYQRQLRALVSELSLVEERERRELAVALHDTIAQRLALSKMLVGSLAQASSTEESTEQLSRLNKLLEEAIHSTRTLTFELSPPILYELGFEPAVEWLTEQIQHQYRVKIRFVDDHKPKPLADDVRVILFQAVRELLNNAGKHAQADQVTVTLSRAENNIVIQVQDDGIGFDADLLERSEPSGSGFGIFSIRVRLESLGGTLDFKPAPIKGTCAMLVAPLRMETSATKRENNGKQNQNNTG